MRAIARTCAMMRFEGHPAGHVKKSPEDDSDRTVCRP